MNFLIKLNFKNSENLLEIIDEYYSYLISNKNLFLININNEIILDDYIYKCLNKYKNLFYFQEDYKNDVQFLNSNINKIKDWDIIFNPSFLVKPIKREFDKIIKNLIKKDVSWLNDGEQDIINTLPVITKKYYEKFGYFYNPIYKNNYYLNEFTEVSKILNDYYFIDDILFERIYLDQDEIIYNNRKEYSFTLGSDINIFERNENIEFEKWGDNIYNMNIIKNNNQFKDQMPLDDVKVDLQKNIVIKKDSEILKEFLKSNSDFYIYKNNKIIFDSYNNKLNINVYDNFFEIYGKSFDYRGIRIKNKN